MRLLTEKFGVFQWKNVSHGIRTIRNYLDQNSGEVTGERLVCCCLLLSTDWARWRNLTARLLLRSSQNTACVFSDARIAIADQPVLIEHDTLHYGAKAKRVEGVRLVVPCQVDGFCVAATLDVEYAFFAPALAL